MYLKFDKDFLTDEQLYAIANILECNGIECIYNVHYEACMYEIQCSMENMFETEELKKIQEQPEYYEKINELTNILYNRADHQWNCLYDKAEEIVNDYMEYLSDSLK
jgi:hypothetical protein